MPNTYFHLQLTGPVGSPSFDAASVRRTLAQYPAKHVDVLVDSLGGSLATGLSISSALRDHGDVTVHFRGMNASAATIASMGAKHISIAPDAFYLVHKCSMDFYDWASRNADQLQDFIDALKAAKDDLDNIDKGVAELYASRCKKKPKDILDLMRRGAWLTARQALDLGFVDEISGSPAKEAPSITQAQASYLFTNGLPSPPVPVIPDQRSLLQAIKSALKSIFTPDMTDSTSTKQPAGAQSQQDSQQQQQPAGAKSQQASQQQQQPAESQTTQTSQQPTDGQQASQHGQQQAADPLQAVLSRLEAIEARLNKLAPEQPAQQPGQQKPAVSASVVAQPVTTPKQEERKSSPLDDFFQTTVSASRLFNSIP